MHSDDKISDKDFLCQLLKKVAHEGISVLELGIERGISTFAMADIVKEYKGCILAVDKWENENMFCEFFAKASQSYQQAIFPVRVNLFGLDQIMDNNTFDFIHFDACYTWPEVRNMIVRYLPKLKPGGIACGHGADMKWSSLPEAAQNYYSCFPERIEVVINGLLKHVNLAHALYEIFGDDYTVDIEHGYWYWQKPLVV